MRARVVSVFLVVAAAACSRAAPAVDPPRSRAEGADEPSPPRPIVRVDRDSISVDGTRVAAVRPAAAPGILDAELRPGYAIPELAAALGGRAPGEIVLDAQTTVGTLRSVLASAGAVDVPIPVSRAADGAPVPLRRAEPGPNPSGPSPDAARLDAPDDAPAAALLGSAAASADGGVAPWLAFPHEPCLPAPAGMACVPGGPAIVGRDDGPPEERPRREVVISTFYVDLHEVTTAQYDACAEAGGCKRRINGHQKIMQPFVAPSQPAVPLDWERGRRYCAWAGKRLPTEWEWEKAARGPAGALYPWGDEPPTCDRAQYRECAPRGCTPYPGKQHPWDCNEHATRPVGSYPAGHYGLFDMAGNGYEWTASSGIESIEECGDACRGTDPRGPCDGADSCGKMRVLRGGSWYWPAGRVVGSHRRIEKIHSGGHRLSVRCALSAPPLATYPPLALDARARPPDPTPPSTEQLALVDAIAVDAIADKPICPEKVRQQWDPGQIRGGRSAPGCRDPFPYLESNEPRAWVWGPYLENLGGAYLGVGSDQNYSMIALARAQWAFVIDYDPRVVAHHRRVSAFVRRAASPREFVQLWADERAGLRALSEVYADSPELSRLRAGYVHTRERLHEYFEAALGKSSAAPEFGWLRNVDHYGYVRALFDQGRLRTLPGDLMGQDTIAGVAAAVRALGVPLRVFYTSNAPTAWGGEITDGYRRNILALPFDAHSIVLQTSPSGGFRQVGKWHYNVEGGHHLQTLARRPGYRQVYDLMADRIPAGHGDLTIVGLPGRT